MTSIHHHAAAWFNNQLSWDGVIQALAVIAAFVAVWVALRAAANDRRDRKDEREARETSEARLFRIRSVDAAMCAPEPENHHALTQLKFFLEHQGPEPILDIVCEAWPRGHDLIGEAPLFRRRALALPGSQPGVLFDVDPNDEPFSLIAWRVRWSDKYGNQWVVDQIDMPTPRRYQPGEAPNPVTGVAPESAAESTARVRSVLLGRWQRGRR